MTAYEYTGVEAMTAYLLERCRELLAGKSSEVVQWVGNTPGEVAQITVKNLPISRIPRMNLERAIYQAFRTVGPDPAAPFPVHTVVIDVNDKHIRLYTTPKR